MRAHALWHVIAITLSAAVKNANSADTCRRSCECDKKHEMMHRIVGGYNAKENEYPFLALLTSSKFMCGGSVITRRHILTAAHCIDTQHSDVTASLGVYNSDKLVNRMKVVEMLMHYDFLGSHQAFGDIGIATMEKPVHFDHTIQPACLPKENARFARLGEPLQVIGWGYTEEDGTVNKILQKVDIETVNHEQCAKNYKRDNMVVTDSMICAGDMRGGKDACQGDSGGPLIHHSASINKRFVIGVVSFGKGCARPGYPGVYTAVSNYRKWILENIGEECLCDL